MIIQAKELISMAFSYENGMLLRDVINKALANNEKVIVDFAGITVFTTMFFNACSGHFVLQNSLEWYNEKIECINLNPLGEQTHKHSIENAEKKRTDSFPEKSVELSKIISETIAENT